MKRKMERVGRKKGMRDLRGRSAEATTLQDRIWLVLAPCQAGPLNWDKLGFQFSFKEILVESFATSSLGVDKFERCRYARPYLV